MVATVGAEPVAAGGYAAALLLDGDSLLRRENLRAGEDAVRRWFNAAALVRPATEGGLVVITADDTAGVGALLRWDPAGYAQRELALRAGTAAAPGGAGRFRHRRPDRRRTFHRGRRTAAGGAGRGPAVGRARPPLLQTGRGVRTSGRAGEDVRTLLFIPYAQAADSTRVLRAVKAAAAAKRSDDPVQLRLDGVDVLCGRRALTIDGSDCSDAPCDRTLPGYRRRRATASSATSTSRRADSSQLKSAARSTERRETGLPQRPASSSSRTASANSDGESGCT